MAARDGDLTRARSTDLLTHAHVKAATSHDFHSRQPKRKQPAATTLSRSLPRLAVVSATAALPLHLYSVARSLSVADGWRGITILV